MLRALHRDIHCKNVRWSNGTSAPCSGADDGADESTSPQVGISLEAPRRWRLVPKTGDARNGGQSLGGARAFLMLIPCYRSPGSAQDLVPKMPWSAAERSIPRMPRAARGTQRVSLVRRTRTRN